jgi:hypothetical protein
MESGCINLRFLTSALAGDEWSAVTLGKEPSVLILPFVSYKKQYEVAFYFTCECTCYLAVP